MNFKITCCKDCKDRYLGCHDKCEKYIKQKLQNEKERNAYREYKGLPIIVNGKIIK